MAGENQHYDPRFLLKGFASQPPKGKTVFVWYFEKNSTPTEKCTREIGYGYLFYGHPGENSLDERITKKETRKYSKVVERLRQTQKVHPSDKEVLAEFVCFQAVRTKYIREQLCSVLDLSIHKAHQKYGNPAGMEQFMREILRPENKELQTRWSDALKKHGYNLSFRQKQILLHRVVLQNEELRKTTAIQQSRTADMTLSILSKKSKTITEKGHNEGLSKFLTTISQNPALGLRAYRQLQWSVQKVDDRSLILSDAVVLYRETDSSPLSAGLGKASLVLLPLSHNLLLIGAVDDGVKLPSLDDINRSAAKLSHDFFVSSYCTEREMEYHNLIGISDFTT